MTIVFAVRGTISSVSPSSATVDIDYVALFHDHGLFQGVHVVSGVELNLVRSDDNLNLVMVAYDSSRIPKFGQGPVEKVVKNLAEVIEKMCNGSGCLVIEVDDDVRVLDWPRPRSVPENGVIVAAMISTVELLASIMAGARRVQTDVLAVVYRAGKPVMEAALTRNGFALNIANIDRNLVAGIIFGGDGGDTVTAYAGPGSGEMVSDTWRLGNMYPVAFATYRLEENPAIPYIR